MKTQKFTLKLMLVLMMFLSFSTTQAQIVLPTTIQADTIYVVEVNASHSANYGGYWEMNITFMDSITVLPEDTIFTPDFYMFACLESVIDTSWIDNGLFFRRYYISAYLIGGIGWVVDPGLKHFTFTVCDGNGHCSENYPFDLYVHQAAPEYQPEGQLVGVVGTPLEMDPVMVYTLEYIKIPLSDYFTNPLTYDTPYDSLYSDSIAYTIDVWQDTVGVDTILNYIIDPFPPFDTLSVDTVYVYDIQNINDTIGADTVYYYQYFYEEKPLNFSLRLDEYGQGPQGSIMGIIEPDTLYCLFDEYLMPTPHLIEVMMIVSNDSASITEPLHFGYVQNNAAYLDTVIFQSEAYPGEDLYMRFTAGDTLLIPQDTLLDLSVEGPDFVDFEYYGYVVIPPSKSVGDTLFIKSAVGEGTVPDTLSGGAKSTATYDFIVTATDWQGNQDVNTYTLTVTDGLVSIAPVKDEDVGITVYPNPTMDYINLDMKFVPRQVGITDLHGRYSQLFEDDDFKNIDVSHLPTGIYLLHVDDGERIIIKKFVKQ